MLHCIEMLCNIFFILQPDPHSLIGTTDLFTLN